MEAGKMADRRRIEHLGDDDLAVLLRGFAERLAVPAVTSAFDPARRARLRLEAAGTGPATSPTWLPRRRLPRSLVLALAAVLILAAVAGAITFGLPGLRIVFAPASAPGPSATTTASVSVSSTPSPTSPSRPSPSAGPPGSGLSLGHLVSLDEARRAAVFPIALPADPALGPPDASWIDEASRVTFVWSARPTLPTVTEPDIGLIVSELSGHIDRGYFEKILAPGTTIEPQAVNGAPGYWISGAVHEFIYVGPDGEPTADSRRLVGDTLAWSVGNVTYRIESAIGREAAVRLAETIATGTAASPG